MDLSEYTEKDQKLLQSWLSVIGVLIVYWSPVERQIDQCAYLLFKEKTLKKGRPLALNKKLEFIRNNLPDNIVEEYDIDGLIKLTKQTVKIRDVCVHGVLDSFDNDWIKISKINAKSEDHLIEIFTIDKNRLDTSTKNLIILVEKWHIIANILLNKSTIYKL